jgi:AraC-like DNA-binding protein
MKVTIIPAPEILKENVECFRITEHSGDESLSINVCINGLPGIVFQHVEGHSPLESIATRQGSRSFNGQAPTLFVYGQIMQRGVMKYQKGPFISTQILLKPHALNNLLGINAAQLTNQVIPLSDFCPGDLNCRLLETKSEVQRINSLTTFLITLQERAKAKDSLIQESLCLIHVDICSVRVKSLLEHLSISESHFERRFTQSIGISPQFYIRIRRFNQAMALLKSRRFARLTDIAHSLNFYDQSHFIRDIKEFSGLTPKRLFHTQTNLFQDQGGSFYVQT